MDESSLLLHSRQVKQVLCQAFPAPRISSARNTYKYNAIYLCNSYYVHKKYFVIE